MGKHYALSDLHGCYDYLSAIKNYISEDDTVFFLGDAADRGSQGWDCIKSIRNDERFYYLCGNHEDMLKKAMIEYYDDQREDDSNFFLLYGNGGGNTFNDWIEDGAKYEWVRFLDNLPLTYIYHNKIGNKIILSHAGFTPCGAINLFPARKVILWDRQHFNDEWIAPDDVYIVHGHTPTPHLKASDRDYTRDFGAISYCNDHKFCIDNGTVWTGKCTLFDLDTFDTILFSRSSDGGIQHLIIEYNK